MPVLIIVLFVIALVTFLSIRSIIKQKKQKVKAVAHFEAQQYIRIINDSVNIIKNTKNIDTLKSRADVLNTNIERLKEVESRGYQFTDKSASYLSQNMWSSINNKIVELGNNEYTAVMNKKESFSSIKTAITAISKAQQKLIDLREAIYNNDISYQQCRDSIQKMHDNLRDEVFIGQLKEILDKADKEEFKGNNKKANELYLEALHHLKTANFDISKYANEKQKIELKIEKMKNA